MSLQSLWSFFSTNPAWVINALALFFCVAGGWLLVATGLREQFARAELSGSSAADGSLQSLRVDAGKGAALNRFFYGFGGVSLAFGLMLSLASRLI